MYLISNGGVIIDNLTNTKESILLDKFNQNDGVLIDVRITNDNVLILCKDAFIYKKYFINKTNYNLLKKIRLSKIHHLFIPTLKEVLKDYSKKILVIKLHHNYNQNYTLIEKLQEELNHVKSKIIIIPDSNNLYDYLKKYTNYEICLEKDFNKNIVNIKKNMILLDFP